MKEIKTGYPVADHQSNNDSPIEMESAKIGNLKNQNNYRDLKYQDENPENVHISSQMEQNYMLKTKHDG